MSKLKVREALTDGAMYRVLRNRKLSMEARWVWAYCHTYRRYEGAYHPFERVVRRIRYGGTVALCPDRAHARRSKMPYNAF